LIDSQPIIQTGQPADLTVIIIAYRSRATIGACLEALRAQTLAPAEIILIENGSPPEDAVTREMAGPGVTYIASSENLGFAGGNNFAAARAATRWLALLNPDAEPLPDWIEQLMQATGRYPQDKLFGSLQLGAKGEGKLDGVGDVYHAIGFPWRGAWNYPESAAPEHDGAVFSACGAAMLIDRDFFVDLGGFDEAFFCYCEDVDLGYRVRLAGERVIQLADAKIRHIGAASSDGADPEGWKFRVYHGTRNRLWTYLQNTPLPLLILTAPLHAAATLLDYGSAIRRERAKVFGRAIADALKQWPRIMQIRRERQSARRAGLGEIARALTWNLITLARRDADLREAGPKSISRKPQDPAQK
jgi:GT2 family glycosyltransferase